MKRVIHIVSAGALLAAAGTLTQGVVRAQVVNPYAQVFQNQMNQQWAAQQMYAAQANPYSPYAGGNPYSPYGGGSPYAGGLGAGYNPFNPFNPYYNPYYTSPGVGYGVSLMGQAEVLRSYGKIINDQESARILREQANQAKLDTRKKAFDLEMYIKANTPTFTQEQERIAKQTLRRIQTLSLAGEVSNGKALNILIDDIKKYPSKAPAGESSTLSGGILSRLNVTKNTFGIGLFRDGGRLSWPVAMQELMTANKRQELDKQIKSIVEDAYRGRLNGDALKDVTNEINKLREVLISKSNDIPTSQYQDAKRFLTDFDQAVIGLQKGEAQVQAKYQRYVEEGKTIQELSNYMIENGLRFAPATADDEAAYRAVYDRMARYDVALNAAAGNDEK